MLWVEGQRYLPIRRLQASGTARSPSWQGPRPAPSAAACRRCRRRFRTGDGGWRWPPPPPRRGTGRGTGRARRSRRRSAQRRRGGTATRRQVRRGEPQGPSREALPGDPSFVPSFPRGRPAGGSPPRPRRCLRCGVNPRGAGGPRGSRGAEAVREESSFAYRGENEPPVLCVRAKIRSAVITAPARPGTSLASVSARPGAPAARWGRVAGGLRAEGVSPWARLCRSRVNFAGLVRRGVWRCGTAPRGRGWHRGPGPAGCVRFVVGPGGRGDPCGLWLPRQPPQRADRSWKRCFVSVLQSDNETVVPVKIDILVTFFNKIGVFSEDKMFSFE